MGERVLFIYKAADDVPDGDGPQKNEWWLMVLKKTTNAIAYPAADKGVRAMAIGGSSVGARSCPAGMPREPPQSCVAPYLARAIACKLYDPTPANTTETQHTKRERE